MVKNTWTRIAARWNDENQNKVNIDTNAAEYCSSFEYDIMHLADYLTQKNFVNDRVKKISDATFNIFETNGTFYVLTENGYDLSDDVEPGDNFDTYPDDMNELIEVINNMNKYISKYDLYMNKLINNFQQSKNDKVTNYKIAKELEKFKGAVNQFCQLLSQEYNNIEKFEPFYVIKRPADGYYLAQDGEMRSKNIEDYKFYDKGQAKDIIEDVVFADDASEDDYEIITINNQKENADFEKDFNRNQF